MKKVNLLSRAEMRKVMGGVVPEEGTKKCSCDLTGAGGLIVAFPLSTSLWSDGTTCTTACKNSCEGAPLCSHYDALYTSSSPE